MNQSSDSSLPKLVRDKIPEIIAQKEGKHAITKILDDEAFVQALLQKVIEEAHELAAHQTDEEAISELADLLEVIDHFIEVKDIDRRSIEAAKQDKREMAGSFHKRLLLVGKE